jgi:uncharacterized integral membrane protein
MKSYARILLAFAALILATGAFLHGSAFPKIESAIALSDLAPSAGKSLKALWLIDSATSLVIALVFILIATNPASASRGLVALVALIPTATAILIYYFIGNFIGGHVNLAAGLLSFAAALLKPPA